MLRWEYKVSHADSSSVSFVPDPLVENTALSATWESLSRARRNPTSICISQHNCVLVYLHNCLIPLDSEFVLPISRAESIKSIFD